MTEDSRPVANPHIGFMREPDLEPPRRRTGRRIPQPMPTRDRSAHGRKIRDETASTVSRVAAKRQRLGIAHDHLVVLRFSSLDQNSRDVLKDRLGAAVVDERMRKEDEKDFTQLIVQFPTTADIERLRSEARLYSREQEESGIIPRSQLRPFFDGLVEIREMSREERTGSRLRTEGFPDEPAIQLDVDLWHPGGEVGARVVLDDLRTVCSKFGGRVADDLRTSSLILARVVGSRTLGEALLDLDCVAQVNLPPLLPSAYGALFQDRAAMRNDGPPTGLEPVVGVIDSGVLAGHPLLRQWVVAEEDFGSGEDSVTDKHGHGTQVAGLAMYGSIKDCIDTGVWDRKVMIASGKVLRRHPWDESVVTFPDDVRPEALVVQAIRHFHATRNCRVFNLSVGNRDDVYGGGRQYAWAEALDQVARELDIIVVVSAGNDPEPQMPGSPTTREEFQAGVRHLLLSNPLARVCNPATAALAVTVGAISRTASPRTRDSFAAAPRGAPAPFSRVGPGYEWKNGNHGVKPDFVAYGGNLAVQSFAGAGPQWVRSDLHLGELTTRWTSDDGRQLTAVSGTSVAAPQVSHAAAWALKAASDALGHPGHANVARAILGVSAASPPCDNAWLGDPEAKETWEKLRLAGFGMIDVSRVRASLNNDACLVASDQVKEDCWHIYPIPVPDAFLAGTESRGISVALAFDPPVRSSRKEYLSRTMWVEMMKGLTLTEVEGYRTPYSGEGKPPKFPQSKLLSMRPNKTGLYWSTLQVRRKEWRRFPGLPTANGHDRPVLHVLVGCQRRFPHGEDPMQTYGLAVRFWHEDASVTIYQELRASVRARLVVQA